MNVREFFFRYRGYTPVPLALIILILADGSGTLPVPGAFFLLSGELLRLTGVRHAGGATRTRKAGAQSLCTSGPFAHVRNPLYLGNLLIYAGVVLLAGGPYLWALLAATVGFFAVQYGLIVSLEEETLESLFGQRYVEYKKNVPRLVPRLTPWEAGGGSSPFPWAQAIKTERGTLETLGGFLLILAIRLTL